MSLREGNFPPLLKKYLATIGDKKCDLGVSDKDLANHIVKMYPKINVFSDDRVVEVCRGIRIHFSKFFKEYSYTSEEIIKSQKDMGNAISRKELKVKKAKNASQKVRINLSFTV